MMMPYIVQTKETKHQLCYFKYLELPFPFPSFSFLLQLFTHVFIVHLTTTKKK